MRSLESRCRQDSPPCPPCTPCTCRRGAWALSVLGHDHLAVLTWAVTFWGRPDAVTRQRGRRRAGRNAGHVCDNSRRFTFCQTYLEVDRCRPLGRTWNSLGFGALCSPARGPASAVRSLAGRWRTWSGLT